MVYFILLYSLNIVEEMPSVLGMVTTCLPFASHHATASFFRLFSQQLLFKILYTIPYYPNIIATHPFFCHISLLIALLLPMFHGCFVLLFSPSCYILVTPNTELHQLDLAQNQNVY